MTKSLKVWSEKLNTFLADGQEHFLFAVQDKTEVGYGFDKDVDFDYCRKNGITTYDQKRDGGAIVFAERNITLAGIYNNRAHEPLIFSALLFDLAEFISEKGVAVASDGNDILVGGKKVASGFSYNFGDKYHWTYGGIQISINQDIDTIKKVCKKPMVKIPAALEEYGFTTEDIAQWCNAWFKSHDLGGVINSK